ncbi:MAG: hypothetical protein AAB767_02205 [Patescibacteria group bacterium]
MSRTSLLYILTGLISIVAALHGVAIAYSLYWHFSWFDILPHSFGGMFVSLLAVWLWFFSGYLGAHPLPNQRAFFWITVTSALVIGVGWEIFERGLGHTWSPEGYLLDTFIDVISDTIGGIIIGLFLMRTARQTLNPKP